MAYKQEPIRGKNPFKQKPIPVGRMEWAIQNSLSMKAAARLLQVSYPTFKKYAILYGLFNPNSGGAGIPKMGSTGYIIKVPDLFEGKHPKYPHWKIQQLLIKTGHMIQECDNCGYNQLRREDNRGPFLIDFIDNDGHNHSRDNMRLLCYNCFYLIKPAGRLLKTPTDVAALRRKMHQVFEPTEKERELLDKEDAKKDEKVFPKERLGTTTENTDTDLLEISDPELNFNDLFKEMGLPSKDD
ncbi:MAG: hypothetical protein H8E03_00845 [Pelagibacteraceae bacterium]|nr:hypothetical protein [Pelagibacteraceae bacterium]